MENMYDFRDICVDMSDKYDIFCEVEDYYADPRITKVIFRVQSVGTEVAWASVSVPTKQACEPLVKRFVRASILANYAKYGDSELKAEAETCLKSLAREARRNNSFQWIADRAETLI